MAEQDKLFVNENEGSQRTVDEWLRICEQESESQGISLNRMSVEQWEILLNDVLEGIPSI
jgi:hypothetical protein